MSISGGGGFAATWRTDTIAAKLRREVEEMVRDLNGTTERNIALIENRIASLNELIDKAGKTTGVLRRESEKHDIASQVYTSLERSRPLTPSLNLVVDDEAEKKKQPENGNPSPSGAEAEEIGPAATPGAGGVRTEERSGRLPVSCLSGTKSLFFTETVKLLMPSPPDSVSAAAKLS